MVKKLFKYEFIHYMRALLPFELILLIVASFSRIIQIFDDGSQTYNIIFGSSTVMYGIAIVLCLVMCFVSAITRYYKNLFTAEGYLTMTLPVTENQHLFVKWITAFLTVVISFVIIMISACIMLLGEPLVEVFKAITYLFKDFYEMSAIHTVSITIEVIVGIFLAILYVLMLFYTCITIGQLAKKNRILASFGVYFGYYVLTQIFGTIVLVLMMTTNLVERIGNLFMEFNVAETFHIIFGFLAIFIILLTCVFIIICKKIIRKRLNLE